MNDLKVFDKTFGLPAPPSLKILQPAGAVPPYDPTNGNMVGWAGETTLDVEYAHTIAPGVNIVLVETPVAETEGVTGVGGTQLHLNANGNHVCADTVWNDTYGVATNQFIFGDNGPNPLAGGGGKSVLFDRPSYQNGVRSTVGRSRGVPDISMSGACNGAVDVYQSFGGQPAGWYPTCGTSEATPLFAGIVALANQMAYHPLGLINPALYLMSEWHLPGIDPVTSGNNTVSFTQNGKLDTVKGFSAKPVYSLATGVGTVNGALFVPELAFLARR